MKGEFHLCHNESQRTGKSSTTSCLGEDCPARWLLEEQASLHEELLSFVSRLSLTDVLLAVHLLQENDHAGVAGLVTHFMAYAMSMSTGGD